MNGGAVVARVLERHRVGALFTLCGGHISPILVEAKRRGIRVIDVRDEASAAFAADAYARLTGIPGVAAVTAGPGVTNALTAVMNARLAQSPMVLLGGAAATILKGRGALQDIDQLAAVRPHVKWARAVKRLRDLEPTLERAFAAARDGVPGPVFVECPVDVLYGEAAVRAFYEEGMGSGERGLAARVRARYVAWHLKRLFAARDNESTDAEPYFVMPPDAGMVGEAAGVIARAERPVAVLGSQAMLRVEAVSAVRAALERLGIPTYCSGMARGVFPRGHELLRRHARGTALREADVVLLAGVPLDFRLQYGGAVNRKATVIAVNRDGRDLQLNRAPDVAVLGDPSLFLERLGERTDGMPRWLDWRDRLLERDRARDEEITRLASERTDFVNPIALCAGIDRALDDRSILVLDGGDFVATASYVVAPRRPLSFLDPGVFGTLGVGGGFALGAAAARPDGLVWLLYGDGSAAFSIAEFDTMVRHRIPVIAVVGNDGAWTQIARGQRDMLGDAVGTELRRTDYERVAEGYGGVGLRIEHPDEIDTVLATAKEEAAVGRPVLVNALIGTTSFRDGSISL
jgi:acetolactate synthase-1/2/3 large subunit